MGKRECTQGRGLSVRHPIQSSRCGLTIARRVRLSRVDQVRAARAEQMTASGIVHCGSEWRTWAQSRPVTGDWLAASPALCSREHHTPFPAFLPSPSRSRAYAGGGGGFLGIELRQAGPDPAWLGLNRRQMTRLPKRPPGAGCLKVWQTPILIDTRGVAEENHVIARKAYEAQRYSPQEIALL